MFPLRFVSMAMALLAIASTTTTVTAIPMKASEASIDPLGIIRVDRKIDVQVTQGLAGVADKCSFAGTVTLGGPFSLSSEDKFYNIGSKQMQSFELVVDFVNRHRCGVNIQGQQYALALQSYDDQSDKEWTTTIGKHLADRANGHDVDVLLGGYSSGLTVNLAAEANETGRLLLAPGAASTGVFKDRPGAFGTFPPTAKYTAQAVKALAEVVGAKSIATLWEDASFTAGVCAAIPELAEQYGLELTSQQQVVKSPNVTVLTEIAQNISKQDPDVVMTCTYDEGCKNWMAAMQEVNWSPKAQVFTVCVGLGSFVSGVGADAEYIMGVTPWDQSLNIVDQVTGWSAQDFADEFARATGDVDVTYHAASAASVISIAVQAIETTNSLNEAVLSEHIAKATFPTIYGSISFDANGQSQAPSLLVQYDANGTVQTVYPEDASSGSILYPMPTWDDRQCQRHSLCVENGNTCNDQGLCICEASDEYPVGSGATATCIPEENMNFITPALKSFVYFLIALTLLIGVACMGWIYVYRDNTLVKVAQPICLSLIAFGCIVSTFSMIPMGYETEYRDTSPDIRGADAACMAIPWLWGLGFTICFSSLFAKVWRVKQLFKAVAQCRRVKVGNELIVKIMGGMLLVECTILVVFQIVSPQIWEREVLDDVDGYATESEGGCASDSGLWFWFALVVFHILSLLYALILCFQTKNIPSDFAETSHIFLAVMFLFQVMMLGVPVSVMVMDDPIVFYFVRAFAVFLQNFSVLVIIFSPKMYRIYSGEDTSASVRASVASGRITKSQVSNRRSDNSKHNNNNDNSASATKLSEYDDTSAELRQANTEQR